MVAMPEESRAEDVEKVLAEEKAVEDRKKRVVADLLKQREAAIKDFDEKLAKLGYHPDGKSKRTRSVPSYAARWTADLSGAGHVGRLRSCATSSSGSERTSTHAAGTTSRRERARTDGRHKNTERPKRSSISVRSVAKQPWTGAALIAVIIVARETCHREWCRAAAEVSVDDKIKVPGSGHR